MVYGYERKEDVLVMEWCDVVCCDVVCCDVVCCAVLWCVVLWCGMWYGGIENTKKEQSG